MPATLTTAPPARSFGHSPIWVRLTTDETIPDPAAVELLIASTGPLNTETIRIQWLGADLTFTVSSTPGEGALDLPVIGGDTLAVYADKVQEAFLQNEIISQYFKVRRSSAGGEKVILEQRYLEAVNITATSTLTNVTVTVTDVVTVSQSQNLRGMVEVYRDTGTLENDDRLITLHAPYVLPSNTADLDISAAFAILKPHLPDESTVYPGLFVGLLYGEATSAWTKYYLRFADKAGLPAVAQQLQRSASYYAIHGYKAAASNAAANTALRHNYVRADGQAFVKPTTEVAPEYIYWVCPTGVTSIYIGVTIYWSDGTESAWEPFGTDGDDVTPASMYWIATGYRQLLIHTSTVPPGAEPDAYIIGYRAQITRTDGLALIGEHGVTYSVQRLADWGAHYLLFDNGVGGCETVPFLGKRSEKYIPTAEQFEKPRLKGWTSIDGDIGIYNASGREAWDYNTGWYSDPYYLQHLRQLPLAHAWYCDLVNKKLRKVIVTPGEIETSKSDETLFNLPFTVISASKDQAYNL